MIFGKNNWHLINCLSGEAVEISRFPFEMGSSEASDLKFHPEPTISDRHCALVQSQNDIWLTRRTSGVELLLDGVDLESGEKLEPKTDYSLKIGNFLFLLRADTNGSKVLNRYSFEKWLIQDLASGATAGPVHFSEIAQTIAVRGFDRNNTVVAPKGSRKGFFYTSILAYFEEETRPLPPPLPGSNGDDYEPRPYRSSQPAEEEVAPPPPAQPVYTINSTTGKYVCPICWLRFDRPDVLWIADHPDLLGDPTLGPDHMLRFRPIQFDGNGALDPKGNPTNDIACPHCKRRLPVGFLTVDYHIISVVGAPSSGKTYFLTSMIYQLDFVMPREFKLSFSDADAADNAVVNRMKAKLFCGSDNPADIYLDKTDVGGQMFETWIRNGKTVALPKPFTYLIEPAGEPGDARNHEPVMVVFYDNAGENFEPGDRSKESAQHLASADAILFLFDPTTNPEFRKLLVEKGVFDEQLSSYARLDTQISILAEMRNRIRLALGLSANERIDKPLGIVVGKCDVWECLLGDWPIAQAVRGGGLDHGAIKSNSDRVRSLLKITCPNIVGAAEAISDDVVYFPISAFGHSPEYFEMPDDSGKMHRYLGPVPGKINPRDPEVPILWALSRATDDLINESTSSWAPVEAPI